MKKIYTIVGALVVGALFIAFSGSNPVKLGNISASVASTHSSSTISGTATVIFATSTGAQYRSVTNRTAVNVWLGCAPTTGFTAGTGRYLGPSSTMEMVEEQGTMWCTATLYGITDGGTGIVGTEQR